MMQSLLAALVPKSSMAQDGEELAAVDVEEEEGYQPPPQRSIDELLETDREDESLQKYKAAGTSVAGAVAGSGAVVVDDSDPRKVIVKSLSLVVEGREDDTIDLTESLAIIKSRSFTLKEASSSTSGSTSSWADPSGQDDAHGGELRARGRAALLGLPRRGRALGDAEARHLLGRLPLHGRRQDRAPEVGVGVGS
jgi:hypothetical protein